MTTAHPRRPQLAAAALALTLLALPSTAAADGFRSVRTKDGIDVWAVGTGGAVYRSLDGGAVWASYPLGAADLHGVAARGAVVVAVGDSGACFRSGDTGATFTPAVLAGGAHLRDAWLADATTGWVAGFGGTILKTTDGGLTWLAQASGTSADLACIRFAGAAEGWACGTGGALVHTTDGGGTWTASAPFAGSPDLDAVAISGGTLAVAGARSFLATSTDGGASWVERDLRIDARSDVRGAAIGGGGAIWLCGGGGFLRSSTDGGARWRHAIHPIVSGLSDVFFLDAARGWACAETSNLVARTTDGGATWSVPGGAPFAVAWTKKPNTGGNEVRGNTFDIDPVNRDKIYVVTGLVVYASWNRGGNWARVDTIAGGGTKTNAFYVSRSDTLTWVAAVGAPDRITRTTDGGGAWTTTLMKDFGEYGVPLERSSDEPEHLYFGPNDGMLYESTDFGATWSVVSDPGFRSPCDIAVVPDTTGLVYVADGTTGQGNGILHRSSDGGLTFAEIYQGEGSEIPMLATSRLDRAVAYATHWGSGGLRRTTDLGVTWVPVAATPSAWGADIAKDDPNVAVHGSYSGGDTHISTDGGATFVQSDIPNSSNYGYLIYDRGTYLALQSNGVWKGAIQQPGMPTDNAEALALTAPVGGEVWQYGEARAITWTSQNLAAVRIEFSTDGGGAWQEIAAGAPGPAGSYPWIVPDAPSGDARVRVSDADDGAPVASSGGAFSIVVPAIAAAPGALDFGAVPAFHSATDTIRVVNGGTATLVISSVTTVGGEAAKGSEALAKDSRPAFTPSRTSFSVPAGSSDTLAVTFAPAAEAAYAETLVIASNAPGSPTLVPLAGVGSSPVGVAAAVAPRFELRACAPNPFGRDGTSIEYVLPRECAVSLAVYNVAGQEVARLVEGCQPAGLHAVRFPREAPLVGRATPALSSGVYFYRFTAPGFAETRRMVLVR